MYLNYIFDLYGTLVDIRTDESGDKFWGKIADIYESYGATYTARQLQSAYKKYTQLESRTLQHKYPKCKHIEINLENVFYKLYTQKGVEPTKEIIEDTAIKFRKTSMLFLKLYDGVIDLLDSLKASGKKIYLLSNAQRCFTYPELVELGIVDYFDGILISSDCGCKKPDTAFFDILIERYNLDRSKSVMIGNDCITDMQGAKGAGLDSLYIHQEISTPLKGHTLECTYKVMDGDVTKIQKHLIKA